MEEIINNVMQSPENTNPNVLRSQLQNIGSGSGSGVLIVNATPSGDKLVCDKTAAEMYAAFQDGGVSVRFNIEDAEYHVNVISAMKANNNGDYPNYYYFAVSTPPATGIYPFMTTDGDDAYPSVKM